MRHFLNVVFSETPEMIIIIEWRIYEKVGLENDLLFCISYG